MEWDGYKNVLQKGSDSQLGAIMIPEKHLAILENSLVVIVPQT